MRHGLRFVISTGRNAHRFGCGVTFPIPPLECASGLRSGPWRPSPRGVHRRARFVGHRPSDVLPPATRDGNLDAAPGARRRRRRVMHLDAASPGRDQ